MSTKSKGQILGCSRGKLMLLIISILLVHVGKSEWFEYLRIHVEFPIPVQTLSGSSDQRSFRYEGSVRECEVCQSLAQNGC